MALWSEAWSEASPTVLAASIQYSIRQVDNGKREDQEYGQLDGHYLLQLSFCFLLWLKRNSHHIKLIPSEYRIQWRLVQSPFDVTKCLFWPRSGIFVSTKKQALCLLAVPSHPPPLQPLSINLLCAYGFAHSQYVPSTALVQDATFCGFVSVSLLK